MITVKHMFRIDKANLYAMVYGGLQKYQNPHPYQIFICAKNPYESIGPFLLKEIQKPKYTESAMGAEVKKEYSNNYKLQYVGLVESYLKVKITKKMCEYIHEKGFFPVWDPIGGPLKYFEGWSMGYFAIFRIFEISKEFSDLRKWWSSKRKYQKHFLCPMDPVECNLVKPVIENADFYPLKDALISGLRENFWFHEEVPKTDDWVGDDQLQKSKNHPISVNPPGLDTEDSLISFPVEGGKKLVFTTRYERNPELRQKAIQYHGDRGINCCVCGFNFERFYGKLGKDFIEVHHIKPVSKLETPQIVSHVTDMCLVCSNCHSMLHRNKEHTESPENLRNAMLRQNAGGSF